jgi:hypothetical protein
MTGLLIERCRRTWQSVTRFCGAAVLRANSYILIGMTGATVFLGIDLVAFAVFAPVTSALILVACLVWGLLAVRRRERGGPDQADADTEPPGADQREPDGSDQFYRVNLG